MAVFNFKSKRRLKMELQELEKKYDDLKSVFVGFSSSVRKPDKDQYEKFTEENPIIKAVFNEIENDFLSLDFVIVRKDKEEVDNPIKDVLKFANQTLSFDEFKRWWLYQYYFAGECLIKKTNLGGMMIHGYSVNTYQELLDTNVYPYPILLSGVRQDEDDVVISKSQNPFSDVAGKSNGRPLAKDLNKIIDLTNSIFDHNNKTTQNGMVKKILSGYYTDVNGGKNPLDERTARMIDNKIKSFSQNGDSLMFQSGVSFEKIDLHDNLELDFNAGVKLLLELTCAVLNVPVSLVTGDYSTYNNMVEMKKKIYEDTIIPIANKLASDLTRLFNDELGDLKIIPDVKNIKALQSDNAEKVKVFLEATKGNITINEQNELVKELYNIDLPQQSDGDVVIISTSEEPLTNVVNPTDLDTGELDGQ